MDSISHRPTYMEPVTLTPHPLPGIFTWCTLACSLWSLVLALADNSEHSSFWFAFLVYDPGLFAHYWFSSACLLFCLDTVNESCAACPEPLPFYLVPVLPWILFLKIGPCLFAHWHWRFITKLFCHRFVAIHCHSELSPQKHPVLVLDTLKDAFKRCPNTF